MASSITDFIGTLRASRLLEAGKLEELLRTPEAQEVDAPTLTQCLVQLGWLTAYQAEQLHQGQLVHLMVGPYRILDRLSTAGADNTIFRARHVEQPGRFVLRIIPENFLTDAAMLQRFEQAVQLASQLDHPNVARTLELHKRGPERVYVREYVEGMDLAQLVQKCGPLPVPRACAYLHQAAQGLAHAHAQGITHGRLRTTDLVVVYTPNLLGSAANGNASPSSTSDLPPPDATVKVVNFGLGALQPPAADPVSKDLRDLGSVFAFLLGGPQYQIPNDLVPELQTFLVKLLSDQPGTNYTTAAEVVQDLARWIGACNQTEAPTSAEPTSAETTSAHLALTDAAFAEPEIPRTEPESLSTQLERTPPPEFPTAVVEPSSSEAFAAKAAEESPPLAAPVVEPEEEIPTGFVPAEAVPQPHALATAAPAAEPTALEEPAAESVAEPLAARRPTAAKPMRKYGFWFWIGALFGLLLHLIFCAGLVYLILRWTDETPQRPPKTYGPNKTVRPPLKTQSSGTAGPIYRNVASALSP